MKSTVEKRQTVKKVSPLSGCTAVIYDLLSWSLINELAPILGLAS